MIAEVVNHAGPVTDVFFLLLFGGRESIMSVMDNRRNLRYHSLQQVALQRNNLLYVCRCVSHGDTGSVIMITC